MQVHAFGSLCIERCCQRCFIGGQQSQQIRADGEQITTRQGHNLTHIAKARTHDLGGNAILLVIVVNGAHRLHTGVVGACIQRLIPPSAGRLFVPIVDASDKGRNQLHLGLTTRHRLRKGE